MVFTERLRGILSTSLGRNATIIAGEPCPAAAQHHLLFLDTPSPNSRDVGVGCTILRAPGVPITVNCCSFCCATGGEPHHIFQRLPARLVPLLPCCWPFTKAPGFPTRPLPLTTPGSPSARSLVYLGRLRGRFSVSPTNCILLSKSLAAVETFCSRLFLLLPSPRTIPHVAFFSCQTMRSLTMLAALAAMVVNLATAASSFSPAKPPAVPLAVRSPYLNAWLQGGSGAILPGAWPRHWT